MLTLIAEHLKHDKYCKVVYCTCDNVTSNPTTVIPYPTVQVHLERQLLKQHANGPGVRSTHSSPASLEVQHTCMGSVNTENSRQLTFQRRFAFGCKTSDQGTGMVAGPRSSRKQHQHPHKPFIKQSTSTEQPLRAWGASITRVNSTV